MSADVQNAIAKEALELSYMFRQNAALRHGLPACTKYTLTDVATEETPPVDTTEAMVSETTESTTTQPTIQPSPGEGAAAVSGSRSVASRAAPYLLAAASAAGGVGLTAYLWPKPTQPQPPTPQVEQIHDGSLLQYLQDGGYHLPGGQQWQTK